MRKPVLRYTRTAVAVAFLVISITAWGQQSHRGHTANQPAEAAPDGGVDPALTTLTRAVAIQARPDQLDYFHSILDSTDEALEQSRELQTLGPTVNSIPTMNAKSLQLRDALDDVDHYNRRFLATFSKLQMNELKPLTKRAHKSYSFVEKESKTVAERMEPGKIVPNLLTSAAANLEKALSDFRTDQVRLGREMGIQSK
jgi:hypothetical protein